MDCPDDHIDTDSDIEQAWREEIERRMASIENGMAETVAWEDVRERLRSRLSSESRTV
jgi:putative addiction module component (TIGR02574 family)